jgi:hypothetical protein
MAGADHGISKLSKARNFGKVFAISSMAEPFGFGKGVLSAEPSTSGSTESAQVTLESFACSP